jgi:hypothetical protein
MYQEFQGVAQARYMVEPQNKNELSSLVLTHYSTHPASYCGSNIHSTDRPQTGFEFKAATG